MNKIKELLLIPNRIKNISGDVLSSLYSRLRELGCTVWVLPENEDTLPSECRVKVAETTAEISALDAALVLGGDGSIIDASHKLLGLDIPIVGMNYGHIGYLAQMELGEVDLFPKLVEGDYTIDERLLLDAHVIREGKVIAQYTVMNDLVITNGPVARLIGFDVLCDGVRVEHCRADGMIVATPTGSTAYSLSAGGPVLDPSLEGICLTPICPHTLNSRPIILRAGGLIEIKGIQSNNSTVFLNADGRDVCTLMDGDVINITRSAHKTQLIKLKEYGFLNVLGRKLSERT